MKTLRALLLLLWVSLACGRGGAGRVPDANTGDPGRAPDANTGSDASICDRDQDGVPGASCGGPDCDDGAASVHPAAPEQCTPADENCDGRAFDGLACAPSDPIGCTTALGVRSAGSCTDACAAPAGDACPLPPDLDGDGVADVGDVFPSDPLEQGDLDGDGLGDAADADDDGDGVPDANDIRRATPHLEILDSMPPVVLAGEPVDIPVRTVALYNQPVTVSLESAPAGALWDADLSAIRWTPDSTQVGPQTFTLSASDPLVTVRRDLRTVVARRLPGASAMIGPAGGTVALAGPASAGAQLDIPPGALAAATLITLEPLDTGGATIHASMRASAVGSPLLLGPEGLSLAAPATLVFPPGLADPPTDAERMVWASTPGLASGTRPEPELDRDAAGRWRARPNGFSVFELEDLEVSEAERMPALLPGSGRALDRRAQELAVECAWRLQCKIDAGETNRCAAYAKLADCLWRGYEKAAEELGGTFSGRRFLGSLYDLSISDGFTESWLGIFGDQGPRASRPAWVNTHNDGGDGSGFRVFVPGDPDRTGRIDHFMTNAQLPPVAFVADWGLRILGVEESANDLRFNRLGRRFGWEVLRGRLRGSDIGWWLAGQLCTDPTLPSATLSCPCGQRSTRTNGCCEPDPTAPADHCRHARIDGISWSTGMIDCSDPFSCPGGSRNRYVVIGHVMGSNFLARGTPGAVHFTDLATGSNGGAINAGGGICCDTPGETCTSETANYRTVISDTYISGMLEPENDVSAVVPMDVRLLWAGVPDEVPFFGPMCTPGSYCESHACP